MSPCVVVYWHAAEAWRKEIERKLFRISFLLTIHTKPLANKIKHITGGYKEAGKLLHITEIGKLSRALLLLSSTVIIIDLLSSSFL